MTKAEIKELQDSLLVLVPNNVNESKELTRSEKILLGNFYLLNGLDKTKANGYFYRSNKLLVEDTQLTNKTIIKAISHLSNLGFITRSTGNRVEGASVYTLNFEVINAFNKGVIKGVNSEKITPINYTDEIKALRLEINELKGVIYELRGVISNMGVISNYTTDTDIEIDNNKLIDTLVSIPVTDEIEVNDSDGLECIFNDDYNITSTGKEFPKKEKIEFRNIEVCDTDEQSEEEITHDITEINTDNFNFEVTNTNDNLLKTDEMIDKELEEVLRQQAEEQNNLLKEAYNNNFNSYNKESQERYSTLFKDTKMLINEWYKTHDTVTKARIESNLKVVGWMFKRGDISVKQFNTANEKLANHFNKLLKGHLDYIQRKNKNHNSTFVSVKSPQPPQPHENANKAVLSDFNSKDDKVISEANKTQQEAKEVVNMTYIERECSRQNKQFNSNTLDYIVAQLNLSDLTTASKKEWINRYFTNIKHSQMWFVEIKHKEALQNIV